MKRKSLVLIVMLTALGVLSAQADYVQRHADRGIRIISSRNELSRDYYEYYYQFYPVEGLYEKYPDAFFEENFLIIVRVSAGDMQTTFSLTRIDNDGNILIRERRPVGRDGKPAAVSPAMRGHRFVIERSNSERLEEYRIKITM